MPKHLADEVEAGATRHGDRGEAVPKVMNADIVEPGRLPGRVDSASGCRRNVDRSAGRAERMGCFPCTANRSAREAQGPKRHGFGAGLAVGKYQAARSKLIYSHRSDGSPTDGIPENQKSDRGDPLERAEGKDLVALVPIWYLNCEGVRR